MPGPPPMDEVYRTSVDRVIALVSELGEAELHTPVPACPDWTVRCVLAHLAGGSSDTLARRTSGAGGPTPEWTSRQVEERADRTREQLVTELRGNADAVSAVCLKLRGPSPAWDIVVHECDLHEALGRPAPRQHAWETVLVVGMPFALDRLPADPGLAITAGHLSWSTGPDREPAVALEIEPYELFRGLFSRRSRRQLQGWAWDGDPTAAITGLPFFGERYDDQPLPPTPVS